MIVVMVFLLIMNQTEFNLVYIQKENRHYDHISLDLKGTRNQFLRVASEFMQRNLLKSVVGRRQDEYGKSVVGR